MKAPDMILTVSAHPMKIPGVWCIRLGRKVVAALVQPNLSVMMGVLPTATEVRNAVLEVYPQSGVTDQTKVRFAGGELQTWISQTADKG